MSVRSRVNPNYKRAMNKRITERIKEFVKHDSEERERYLRELQKQYKDIKEQKATVKENRLLAIEEKLNSVISKCASLEVKTKYIDSMGDRIDFLMDHVSKAEIHIDEYHEDWVKENTSIKRDIEQVKSAVSWLQRFVEDTHACTIDYRI